MSRWYPAEPVDESFFSTAPHVYRFPVDLPVPPERVWESLTSDRSVADWSPLVSSLQWLTPRPFGIGTRREVGLAGGLAKVHEHFFLWDEGHRYSFYVYEANRPLFRHFAEDYVVEKTASGSRLTWTFALEGTSKSSLLLKAGSPLNKVTFGRMANSSKGYFRKHP